MACRGADLVFPAPGSRLALQSLKYQPYKSCSCRLCRAVKAGNWMAWRGRVRTRHGWAYPPGACVPDPRRPAGWKLADTREQNRRWKREAHRAFRRACKRAIWLEVTSGQEVSQRFYNGGEYLS